MVVWKKLLSDSLPLEKALKKGQKQKITVGTSQKKDKKHFFYIEKKALKVTCRGKFR
jgi:hypothetical protein